MIVGHSRRLAGRRMSRRLLVVGAHRPTSSGGQAARSPSRPRAAARPGARAVVRRARRVRRALEGARPDGRAREGDPSRRGGAGGGRARGDVRVPRPRRLPARDRRARARALADAIRELRAGRARTHTDRDPFNPDHAARSSPSSGHARSPRAPASRAHSRTIAPPELLLFEPHQPELCNFMPTTFVDITPVIEQKRAAMEEMKAQAYLQTYYGQRAEQRGNHAGACRERRTTLGRGVPARDAAGRGRAVNEPMGSLPLGSATVHEAPAARRSRRAARPDRARARVPPGRPARCAAARATT